MKILQHTDDHQPTYMADVYEHFIGKKILVATVAGSYIRGTLEDWNGYMLKLVSTDSNPEREATVEVAQYLPVSSVLYIEESRSLK